MQCPCSPIRPNTEGMLAAAAVQAEAEEEGASFGCS